MSVEKLLLVEKFNDSSLKITNNSKFNVFLAEAPTPPKRKHKDHYLIAPGTFLILDLELCLNLVSFRFEDPK